MTDERIFVVYAALKKGVTVDEVFNITKIDRWFLNKFMNLIRYEEKLANAMKSYDESFETIMIESDDEYSHISSTFVRECLKKGQDLDGIVHKNAKKRMIEIYNSKN
jgi:hypothetical protein